MNNNCGMKCEIMRNMLSLKSLSLCVLVVQTTAHVLTIRYSRTVQEKGPRYLSSTVVVLAEMIKVLVCMLILYYQNGLKCGTLWSVLKTNILIKYVETVKLIIPSGLYVVQNNLLYIALSNLDAATYQVTYQLKILTTAVFAVILLRKQLEAVKWISLILLMIGVALIQLPTSGESETESSARSNNKLIGIASISAACFSSGFAGVYFEKLLKGSTQSIWIRNIQLGIFGILFGLISVFIYEGPLLAKDGIFQGYNITTLVVIGLQAFGGLIVAVVIKYADNILKSFAASISIIFSTVFSYYLIGDLTLSRFYLLGASIVIFATFLYGIRPSPTPEAVSLHPLRNLNPA